MTSTVTVKGGALGARAVTEKTERDGDDTVRTIRTMPVRPGAEREFTIDGDVGLHVLDGGVRVLAQPPADQAPAGADQSAAA